MTIFYGIIVYQSGRLCGGAHEISGIKAPLFLRGCVGVVRWVEVMVGWGGVCGVLVRDVVDEGWVVSDAQMPP